MLSAKTRIVGVVGHPIDHSLSPAMHNAAFQATGLDYCYVAFDVTPAALPAALAGVKALGIWGLNVTIPHKSAAFELADRVAPSARRVEAVNTLHWQEGELVGHNTDGEGFARSLDAAGVSLSGRRVALLGAGGSAASVSFACLDRGAAVISILNRTPERATDLAARLRSEAAQKRGSSTVVQVVQSGTLEEGESSLNSVDLVVQCTPLGMHPHEADPLPVPEQWLKPGQVVCDLIYNPEETRFLQAARKRGAHTLNGVEMLVGQGAVAFEIWTGVRPPMDVMREALLQGLRGG